MSKKVLIVDDSSTVRSLHAAVLKLNGFSVEFASNGVEAIEKLYSTKDINVAVVDINMPKMDGLELLKKIRSEESYADLPVIMVTSEGKDEDIQRGLDAGADIYLIKPNPPEKLLSHIHMLLGK